MYLKPFGQLVYSPSDLVLAMRSPFASWMERFAIESPEFIADIETDQDPMMALLAAKGNTHEHDFLVRLQEIHGVENIAIVKSKFPEQRAIETLEYMRAGHPFIYQAYLQRDDFAGSADFLVRIHGQSDLGDYRYEAWDTKLSTSTRPYFLIQLCCYSWMLEATQGVIPEEAAIMLGDLTEDRFRIARYYSYFERIKKDFLIAQSEFQANLNFMPDPAYYTDYGRWATYAKKLLETSDSLALIANIRKNHIKKLHDAEINTLAEFAQTDKTAVKGIAQSTFSKLKAQAEIQHQSKGLAKPLFKVLQADNGKDLSALPPLSKLDVFFDIEGHPLFDGGLEYLWGASYLDTQSVQGKQYAFKDWWAHTHDQEKLAFEGFIDWAYARWKQDPTMHFYHYANYEVAAMRKLSTRYETRIIEVAELLVNDVMVDLYRIVLNGLLIGEPRYSIKNVEHLYRGKRTTDVANGGDSVVFYEAWREMGGVDRWCNDAHGYPHWQASPEAFDWNNWPELKDIRDYNIDDCESTLELVAWLREQQALAGIMYIPKVKDVLSGQEKTERQVQNADKKQNLKDWQERLIDRFDADEQLKNDPKALLMMALLGFHNRERKPKIWAYFERLEKSDDALFDDDTCVHNIEIKDSERVDDGIKITGHFDIKQPVRKDKFATASIRESSEKVKSIKFSESEQDGVVEFVMSTTEGVETEIGTITLFADEPYINTETLETRLCEVSDALFNQALPRTHNAILGRSKPVFKDGNPYLPINREKYPEDDVYLNAIIAAVRAMDESCLCIQGPPGAGKTFTAKHVIRALVQDGKRIGIMSNSHAAILNLLDSLHELIGNARIAKVGGFGGNQIEFKEKYSEADYPNYLYRPTMSFTKKEPYESIAVVGATAYAFAGSVAFESPVDYLFVDEASQVALANLIAVAGAAKNIVLMGDQMQLEQPIQGSHPVDAGSSALEYILGSDGVVHETQGIFLERTYRMHPDVCLPLSEVVYEGKLQAAQNNNRQKISIPNRSLITEAHGIMVVNVEHDGNRQSSEEEVAVIYDLINELRTGFFTDKHSERRLITDDDIMVVAPYNMQVNLLRERINGECAIGTIDKFQGQEAPVVIISMSVSDVDESSRGIDFVFDINRLNVAISRAQALAIIVVNPGLERCKVNSLKQMEKASFFCRLLQKNPNRFG